MEIAGNVVYFPYSTNYTLEPRSWHLPSIHAIFLHSIDAPADSLVRSPEDLLQLTLNSPSPLLINARLVRFLLRAGGQDPEGFVALLPRFPLDFLTAVAQAASSRDGYATQASNSRGFELLESYLRDVFP